MEQAQETHTSRPQAEQEEDESSNEPIELAIEDWGEGIDALDFPETDTIPHEELLNTETVHQGTGGREQIAPSSVSVAFPRLGSRTLRQIRATSMTESHLFIGVSDIQDLSRGRKSGYKNDPRLAWMSRSVGPSRSSWPRRSRRSTAYVSPELPSTRTRPFVPSTRPVAMVSWTGRVATSSP